MSDFQATACSIYIYIYRYLASYRQQYYKTYPCTRDTHYFNKVITSKEV